MNILFSYGKINDNKSTYIYCIYNNTQVVNLISFYYKVVFSYEPEKSI